MVVAVLWRVHPVVRWAGRRRVGVPRGAPCDPTGRRSRAPSLPLRERSARWPSGHRCACRCFRLRGMPVAPRSAPQRRCACLPRPPAPSRCVWLHRPVRVGRRLPRPRRFLRTHLAIPLAQVTTVLLWSCGDVVVSRRGRSALMEVASSRPDIGPKLHHVVAWEVGRAVVWWCAQSILWCVAPAARPGGGPWCARSMPPSGLRSLLPRCARALRRSLRASLPRPRVPRLSPARRLCTPPSGFPCVPHYLLPPRSHCRAAPRHRSLSRSRYRSLTGAHVRRAGHPIALPRRPGRYACSGR